METRSKEVEVFVRGSKKHQIETDNRLDLLAEDVKKMQMSIDSTEKKLEQIVQMLQKPQSDQRSSGTAGSSTSQLNQAVDLDLCQSYNQMSDTSASATYAACGYPNLDSQAALSTALFNEPLSGGACFELKCANDSQCGHPHSPSIVITASNFCHSNISPPQCNSPGPHFQLAMPTFRRIAQYPAHNASVAFRRVPCQREGGITLNITGFRDKNLVLISNVAGTGHIVNVSIKGSRTGWLQMSRSCRNWRQYWQSNVNLTRQVLSFKITGSDGSTLPLDNIAPANWTFGQSFVWQQF